MGGNTHAVKREGWGMWQVLALIRVCTFFLNPSLLSTALFLTPSPWMISPAVGVNGARLPAPKVLGQALPSTGGAQGQNEGCWRGTSSLPSPLLFSSFSCSSSSDRLHLPPSTPSPITSPPHPHPRPSPPPPPPLPPPTICLRLLACGSRL